MGCVSVFDFLLQEYGVVNSEHRAEIKKHIKDFRNKLGKDSISKGKNKDYKSAKDKLQFWKGKYKVIQQFTKQPHTCKQRLCKLVEYNIRHCHRSIV